MVKPLLGDEIVRFEKDQLKAYGLEMYISEKGGVNIIKNLLAICIVMAYLSLLTLMFTKCGGRIEQCCCCCRTLIVRIREGLVYNSILRFCIETYMPVCLATILGLQNLHGENWTDKICTVMSCFLFIYCLLLPTKFYRFVRENRQSLREPRFKKMFNSIYLNINYYKLQSLTFLTL